MADQEKQHPPEPQPVQPPDDFPVVWQDPEDAQMQWEFDNMHRTEPTPYLESEMWDTCIEGWNAHNEAVEMPTRSRMIRINAYVYTAFFPVVALEDMPMSMGRAEENINRLIDRLEDLWTQEWLPEIQTHLAFWDAFDLQTTDLSGLVTHLHETYERLVRLFDIHFNIESTPKSQIYLLMKKY